MRKSRAIAIWLIALLFVAITAAQSWHSFEVTAEAGSTQIDVSGFQAFPVIGTLLALQLVAVLLSILVGPIVTRFLAGALSGLVTWSGVDVLLGVPVRTSETFEGILAAQTGVLATVSNSEFLLDSSVGVFHILYLVATVINILILISIAILPLRSIPQRAEQARERTPEDLWSKQS